MVVVGSVVLGGLWVIGVVVMGGAVNGAPGFGYWVTGALLGSQLPAWFWGFGVLGITVKGVVGVGGINLGIQRDRRGSGWR